nr:STT3 domain-containing protein [Candidatus Sigynarchaeota archaeon]
TFIGNQMLDLSGRLLSILNPFLRESIALVASVGEHMPSPWSVFYYNTFIPLLFVVPGVYFAYKRGTETDIIFIIYILTLYYFTGSMTRIILLLAPAIALAGSFGISQVLKAFGTIAQKRVTVVRRRKKESRQLLDRPTAGIMFIFIGGLCIGQVFHATNIAATQMPYTEIVVGGQFHDWEEGITWMKTNLNSATVIVSWWDYGYWMTVNGNVTSVNDNATINSTRIGFTGMGMMMTDELESAKIFKMLGADYVLVYYGHLINGLGGDEGKWPWMVKICNDYSHRYKDISALDQTKWYKPGEQVFDYSSYINESSGLYKPNWFNSSLVRMMFYEEPTSVDKATTQLNYWSAREFAGDGSDSYKPRKDDNGKLWTDYFNDPSYSDFKVFRKAFFSSNTTVKIFKLDYTAIESDFNVDNLTVYQNGLGFVNITNTGSKNLNITGVGFNKVEKNVYPFEGSPEVKPNQTKAYWFDANPAPPSFLLIGAGDNHTINVQATVQGTGKTFTINRYKSTIIKNVTEGAISIDRLHSKGDTPNVVEVSVKNTGNITVDVNEIKVDTLSIFDKTKIIPLDQTTVIPVNESRRFQVVVTTKNYTIGESVQVEVTTKENARDATKITFCNGDSNIAFVSDFTTLHESDIIQDNKTFLTGYNLVDFTKPELTTSRNFLPVDLSTSVAYTNGTIRLKVKNTGTTTIGISEVRLNGSTYSGWGLESGSYFVSPGDTGIVRVTYSALQLDAFQDVQVRAIDLTGNTVAADRAMIKTVVGGEAIKVLTENQYTFMYSNETTTITVKNVGTVPTTINRISINGSADIPVTPRTLAMQEAYQITYNVSASSIANFNATDKALLLVKSSTNKESSAIVNVKKNPVVSLDIRVNELKTSGKVSIDFINNGTTGKHLAQNVSWVKFEFNDTSYWVFPKEAIEDLVVEVGAYHLLSEGIFLHIQWPGPQLSAGDKVKITIFSVQGGEASVTVSATT